MVMDTSQGLHNAKLHAIEADLVDDFNGDICSENIFQYTEGYYTECPLIRVYILDLAHKKERF